MTDTPPLGDTVTGPALDAAARAFLRHAFESTGEAWRDEFWENPDDPRARDDCRAVVRVIAAVLREHGALMPAGGETVLEQHTAEREPWRPDPSRPAGICVCGTTFRKPGQHRRTVTTYPEGHPLAGTHYGLWREVENYG
jgi:hypothetical protein